VRAFVASPPVEGMVKSVTSTDGQVPAAASKEVNLSPPATPAESVPGTVMGLVASDVSRGSAVIMSGGGGGQSSLARSAAASYRNKVKNGVLKTDQEARGEAKTNGYASWSPSAPAKKKAPEDDVISISSTDLTISSFSSPPCKTVSGKDGSVFRMAKPDQVTSGKTPRGRVLDFDSSGSDGSFRGRM
jgi:hypothetical protein